MRPAPRMLLLAVATAAAALPAACSGPMMMSQAQREPDEYLGCATDENWRTFDDRERTLQVTTDDAQAPQFQVPAASGMTFAAGGKPTLSWQLSATLPGKPTGTAACAACPVCGPLLPEHLPPVSGDVYDLQFYIDKVFAYRVLTSLQSYTPPDPVWAAWKGKSLSLVAIRVQLKVNDVAAGPYKASRAMLFSVGN